MNPTNTKKGITAYLQGGLGNQLFIYAASLEQAERLNSQLFIDASYFRSQELNPSPNVTPRDYELGELNLPHIVTAEDSIWFKHEPMSLRNRLRARFIQPGISVFRENSSQFDPRINKIRTGTTISGYFQDQRYFESVHLTLLRHLAKCEIATFNKSTTSTPHVTVHVRRGDYLDQIRAQSQVVTEIPYFHKSMSLMEDLIGPFTGTLYTDSPEHVIDLLEQYPNLRLDSDSHISSLGLMQAMSNADGIILSNSSLSWWAARLMQFKNPKAPVFAPRPWHHGGNTDGLYVTGWNIIDQK